MDNLCLSEEGHDQEELVPEALLSNSWSFSCMEIVLGSANAGEYSRALVNLKLQQDFYHLPVCLSLKLLNCDVLLCESVCLYVCGG